MAFDQDYFLPVSAQANSNAPRQYIYKEDTDTLATVKASGYFDGTYMSLAAGDFIHVVNGSVINTLIVSAVTSGVVTTQLQTSQELTATAACTPGVQSLELNHATVVVAATIATAVAHQGLFVVVNTSASGTAAHTLTLTAGTFNGTNNVATLNAPKECLIVWFDSAGNGTIVENVGSVGLS